MGHVYVIRVEDTSLYKVGESDQTPEKRLATLQTGCPYELLLEYSVETTLHREVERLMHAALAPYHRRGEWFDVSFDVIIERLQMLETFIKDESLLPLVRQDNTSDDSPDLQSELPKGSARCPHCRHVFTINNIRRHMQTCQEYK